MLLVFSTNAWADYLWWQAKAKGKQLDRLNDMIEATRRDPFRGIGKPEPLRGDRSGWWSRRINDEHRMVYRVTGKGEVQRLEIAQLRYHY